MPVDFDAVHGQGATRTSVDALILIAGGLEDQAHHLIESARRLRNQASLIEKQLAEGK